MKLLHSKKHANRQQNELNVLRIEKTLSRLEAAVAKLQDSQERQKAAVATLQEAHKRLEADNATLKAQLAALGSRISALEGSEELLEACELMARFEWVVCDELDPEAFSLVNIPLQDSYLKWTTAFGMSKHHLMAFRTILDATVGRVCHPDPEPKNTVAIKRTLCGLCPTVPQPTVSDLVDLAFAKIPKVSMRRP